MRTTNSGVMRYILLLVVLFVTFGLVRVTPAATITVVNLDGPGEGFNDPTPVAAVGGNTGTTLGQQRLNAFNFAATIWANILASNVEVLAGANFDAQTCTPTSAILGSAGPENFFRDFAGAPIAGTWYPVALANALFGSDGDPGGNDIGATFNSELDLGNPGCLGGITWYYGLDASPPAGTIDIVSTILHELAHGLGFLTFVDLATGAKALGFNDAFMLHLADRGAIGLSYADMTDAQRVTASQSVNNLVWTGTNLSSG